MNIDPIFLGLDEEQRSVISTLPRGDRLIELANLRNRPTRGWGGYEGWRAQLIDPLEAE